jgi:hypothetical protein
LAVQPTLGNREARERALFPQRAGHAGHEVLRRLQREKVRRTVRVEACILGHQRPKALDHASGQATDRENVDPAADVLLGHLAVGFRQSTLWEEDEDFSAGTPRSNSAWRCSAARVVLPVPTEPCK